MWSSPARDTDRLLRACPLPPAQRRGRCEVVDGLVEDRRLLFCAAISVCVSRSCRDVDRPVGLQRKAQRPHGCCHDFSRVSVIPDLEGSGHWQTLCMILRHQPTVMISSTITELADLRRTIEARVAGENLANGWLFELHAAAAGAVAEESYLSIARSCDLYVIVLAAQASAATEAEYNTAFEDNPRKILPFYLGALSPATFQLRNTIDSRHTRVVCESETDLIDAVVAGITNALMTAEIVRQPLVANLDARLRRSESVVRGELPISFIPHVRPVSDITGGGSHDSMTMRAASDRAPRLVLEGIGGSGKSYSALTAASWAARSGQLPLLITPRVGQLRVDHLIAAAFDAVGFFPGPDLQQQLARDGRLALVADGIDAIASDDRRVFMDSLDTFSQSSPRCRVLCCVRRLLPNELPSFKRFVVEPISDEQAKNMFEVVGAHGQHEFPTQVRDLARWPLWAWALLDVGSDVETGLVLLQRLIQHRVTTSGSYTPIEQEMLIDASGALAWAAWPQPAFSAGAALDALDRWAATESTRRRYQLPPASVILDRLSGAGIVQQGTELELAHPLFATFLAARHAATNEVSTAMLADPEFAMFVAAVLGRQRDHERLELLARHGPIGQARFLRLAPTPPRSATLDDPIDFGRAVAELTGQPTECIVTADWTAWRASDVPMRSDEASLAGWMTEGSEIAFVKGNAFVTRSPVEMAALEALGRYKNVVLDLVPDEQPWYWEIPPSVLKGLKRMSARDLDERLLQAALDRRQYQRDLARRMGIENLAEADVPDGDPQLRVVVEWSDPRFELTWGNGAVVERVPTDPDRQRSMRPLSELLHPKPVVYRDLVQVAEEILGCKFSSQSWNRPEQVAAWAW